MLKGNLKPSEYKIVFVSPAPLKKQGDSTAAHINCIINLLLPDL